MPRMLIIEDEAANREFMLLALSAHGRCTAVGTAELGLREFARALADGDPFDVVFMDLMLPGMDGQSALLSLRAREDEHRLSEARRARVIVTTVLDDNRQASRAFAQGQAASYLLKPFSVARLTEELRTLGLIDG